VVSPGAILTGSYGAGAFGMLGISPLSPSLVAGFGLTRLQVALIVPSIYVGGLLFSLPGGRLADRLGARPSLLGGLIVGAAGLAVGALSPGFTTFLLCLFLAGIGWSVVNPALGKAIMDLFPVHERGIAMGIKQMGLTLGGIASAIATCGLVVALPVALSWRPLGRLNDAPIARATSAAREGGASAWSWARRPAILAFFASGLVLGMVQAAVLSYLPLYTIQALGFDTIGAGLLVACSQAGGAVSRLALGAASDRWLAERRSVWLAVTGAIGAGSFPSYAFWQVSAPLAAGLLAFATGIGAYGWVGVFFVISAEARRLTHGRVAERNGVCLDLVGLLVGPATFGLLSAQAVSSASRRLRSGR